MREGKRLATSTPRGCCNKKETKKQSYKESRGGGVQKKLKKMPKKMPAITNCKKCNRVLPNDGKIRQRNRPRECSQCHSARVLERRHKDPIRLLQHRFQNSARKWWPAGTAHLTSLAAVRAVTERCQRQCVVTQEQNMDLLCIVPKQQTNNVPASAADLVLVSKRQARELKHMDPAMRALCFL